MAGKPLEKLSLVPVTPQRVSDPPVGSHSRLSPRGAAAAVEHHPVHQAGRLNRLSLLDGYWRAVDVERRETELRILIEENSAVLTTREKQVVQQLMAGQTDRELAKSLGITRQCVCGHLGNGLTKLGLESRFPALQLWRVLAEVELGRGGRASMAEVEYGGVRLISLRCGIPPRSEIETRLSVAETDVAWLVCDGLSNREIAFRRGSAERTVANQVASIFHKLDVSRRFEVALFLLGLR